MDLGSRKLLDRSFSAVGILSILLMTASLVVLLWPILLRGAGAFVFRATVEHRELMLEKFDRGDPETIALETAAAEAARAGAYEIINAFAEKLDEMDRERRREYRKEFREIEELVRELFGPRPGERQPVLMRDRYGQTRWDRALARIDRILYVENYDFSDRSAMGVVVRSPRVERFRGTALEPLFPLIATRAEEMLRPRLTFYPRFLTDESYDSHFFGGIWPEMLGTLYLAIGAMLFAVPFGIVAAIYLAEYAGEGRFVSLLRTCISSLAGVPSIVFGLFGLAFFINTIHVSGSKSVLAGSLTLALLVMPTVIRASEEAIRAVPVTYKEAAMSLGAGKWWTILTVILPASLPGILTSVIISMGRAAGETAPIIFTAAVSVGRPLGIHETLSQPTPALPWNIYNLATEHEAVDEIRHVQYGMVLTLVVMVLLLNLAAIIVRARISKKLRA
ncbi:MAG: phosphate ABC transporter permease PstA [Candidatus Krumholzibacteriota bacterium]|nr:phosphate ABC transporter permease PstA [Candidatus Krumholzibacteriota bacterium]